jgi:hypothetical protein
MHYVATLIPKEMDSGSISWLQVVQCHFGSSRRGSGDSGPIEIDDEDVVAHLSGLQSQQFTRRRKVSKQAICGARW